MAAFAAFKGQTPPPAPAPVAEPSTSEAHQETPLAEAEPVTPPVEPQPTEAAQEPAEPESGTSKRREKLERRFSRLTAERDAAEARAHAAEEELKKLRDAAPSSPPPPVAAAPPATIAEPVEPAPPDLANLDYEQAQAAMLKYTKDVAAYGRAVMEYSKQAASREVAQAQIKAEAAARLREQEARDASMKTAWQKEVERGLKADPDFVEICDVTVGPVLSALGMAPLVANSGVGPEMMIYLDEHPEELNRIKTLPNPVAVAEALGEVKATVRAAISGKNRPAAPPPPALPNPPATVGGSGTIASGSFQEVEDLPQAAFNAKVKSYLKKR
jgi:hypothetical protein